jgi:hypothetical protein
MKTGLSPAFPPSLTDKPIESASYGGGFFV